MGLACTICTHPSAKEIDGLINNNVSYRNIAKQFDIGYAAVFRHTHEHLKLDLAVILQEKRTKRAIDIHEANVEQIERAKEAREFAREYMFSAPEKDAIQAIKAAFDGIKTVDAVLGTQARLTGAYVQDAPNPVNVDFKAAMAFVIANEKASDARSALRFIRDTTPGLMLSPEHEAQLIAEWEGQAVH